MSWVSEWWIYVFFFVSNLSCIYLSGSTKVLNTDPGSGSTRLVNTVDTVTTLTVHKGGEREVVEQVGEVLPHVGVAILAQTLVIEPVHLKYFFKDLFCLRGRFLSLCPEISYIILSHNDPAVHQESGSLWEMPDSKFSALPMSNHISLNLHLKLNQWGWQWIAHTSR